MEIAFVRHGESEANRDGIIQGRGDYALSDEGRRQAKITADALASFNASIIFTSPLKRAAETAEIINGHHNCPITFSQDLYEYNLGGFEGMTMDQVMEKYDHVKEGLEAGTPFHLLAPGGETDEEADQRAESALSEILGTGAKRIIVVAHLGILERLVLTFSRDYKAGKGFSDFGFPLKNCSITRAVVENGSGEFTLINDVTHLGGPFGWH